MDIEDDVRELYLKVDGLEKEAENLKKNQEELAKNLTRLG